MPSQKVKKEPTSNLIKDLLTRRVAQVIDKLRLEDKLKSGKKLTIKLGRDPRVPVLHLGHAVALRKLREFQLQGHHITIVIGDFTALLGDPADASSARTLLTPKQIAKNVEAIKKPFGKILDLKKTKFVHNASWLGKLKFGEVIELASNFTVQQNIERDLFQKRLQAGRPIGLHEFLYPLMQAYDSVELVPDLEVGGTDQTFNLLAGRTLMKVKGLEPQDILTTPMLIGTDGREMHSSWDNYINLTETPINMYGKLMKVRDELIIHYLDLTTDLTEHEINSIATQLKLGAITPIQAKKSLAREVVTLYHGPKAATQAQDEFERVIQSKGIPEGRMVHSINGEESIGIVDLLVNSGLLNSKSEARRLIEQGGVDEVQLEDGQIVMRILIDDPDRLIRPHQRKQIVVQVGKRKAVEVRP